MSFQIASFSEASEFLGHLHFLQFHTFNTRSAKMTRKAGNTEEIDPAHRCWKSPLPLTKVGCWRLKATTQKMLTEESEKAAGKRALAQLHQVPSAESGPFGNTIPMTMLWSQGCLFSHSRKLMFSLCDLQQSVDWLIMFNFVCVCAAMGSDPTCLYLLNRRRQNLN